MKNANWWWFDTIQQTPAYIQELKPFELDQLAKMISFERIKKEGEFVRVLMANPEREITPAMFPDIARLDFLESTLNAENVRRGRVVPTKKETPQPEPLPAFEQVYKGSLSDLWGELSTTPKPLVSKSGNFIWTGENVSVLMALAQALLTADRIEGKRNAESVYRILCAHFGEEAAERQKAVFKNGTSTRAYLDHLATFDDLF
jgi:hypothetical protein